MWSLHWRATGIETPYDTLAKTLQPAMKLKSIREGQLRHRHYWTGGTGYTSISSLGAQQDARESC